MMRRQLGPNSPSRISSAAASLRQPRQGGLSSQRFTARRSTSSRSMFCSSMAGLNARGVPTRAHGWYGPCIPAIPKEHEEPAMGRVAMIVDEMFEDAELRIPYDRLPAAGHEV